MSSAKGAFAVNIEASRKVEIGRRILLLFGLWVVTGIVSIPFAMAYNLFPSFVASSARTGSTAILRVIGALPFVPGGFLGGVGVAYLIRSSAGFWWSSVLGILISGQYVGPIFGPGWSWNMEDAIGFLAALVLLAGSVIGGFALMEHRLNDRSRASAA